MSAASEGRPNSRAPSQAGVKASFSRPSTTQPEENEQKAAPTGETIQTGQLTSPDINDGPSQVRPVLLTELEDESGDNEAQEHTVDQLLDQSNQHIDGVEAAQNTTDTRKLDEDTSKQPEPDIFNDQEWDTDLEDESEDTDLGPPFRDLYKTLCDKNGCNPTSYFLRHIDEKEVHMKHHGLTRHESCALAEVLRSIVCVETLDLEDNWLKDAGCRHLCKMMLENDSVHDMNLAENKLGMVGASHVSTMLKTNHSLQSLSLAANGLDDNIAEVLAEAFEDCRLKTLSLSKNAFGDKTGAMLGIILAANDYLEVLDLSWNMIRGAGAWAIAKGLKENIRLRELDLSWNGLGEKGGIAIAEALVVNSTLTDLNLSANRLNVNVVAKIAKLLTVTECLQVLHMNDNPISTTGAVTLVTTLLNNPNCPLLTLSLEGNPVEFEFLRTLRELKSSREITVTHGSIMRSGNTQQDLGKPAIGPGGPNKPVLIMEENLIINNTKRLQELFTKYYINSVEQGMCNPEELIECLKIMSPGLNMKQLNAVVGGIPRNSHDQIPLNKLFEKRVNGTAVS